MQGKRKLCECHTRFFFKRCGGVIWCEIGMHSCLTYNPLNVTFSKFKKEAHLSTFSEWDGGRGL